MVQTKYTWQKFNIHGRNSYIFYFSIPYESEPSNLEEYHTHNNSERFFSKGMYNYLYIIVFYFNYS